MKKHLISYITNMILSDKRLNKKRARIENKRIKQGLPHTLEVFLAIDDPASYLLLQVLPELQQRYAVRYAFKIVLEKQSSMFPELALWRANVLSDNQKLAALYQLTSPTQAIEDPELSKLASCQLVAMADSDDFITHALVLFHAFWNDDSTTVGSLIEPKVKDNLGALQKCLRDNQAELAHKGHYLSGIIYYGQEWYWGLERLQYLEQRLNELLIAGASVKQVSYNKLHQLCLPLAENWQAPNPKQAEPLTIYFSVRSPYSYLGLWRARKLAEHYQIPLKLKPVLPMFIKKEFRNADIELININQELADTKLKAAEYLYVKAESLLSQNNKISARSYNPRAKRAITLIGNVF